MRFAKMFGLAALAAVAAMAFLGASTASAETQLCKADEELCSAANAVSHLHLVSTTKALLKTSIGTIECDVLFLSSSVLALALWQIVHGTFTYTNCSSPQFGTCEAVQTSTSALIEIMRTGADKAESKGTATVLAKCGKSLHCVYNGEGLVGSSEGPLFSNHSTITEQTTHKVEGFLCPETSKLTLLMTTLPGESVSIAR